MAISWKNQASAAWALSCCSKGPARNDQSAASLGGSLAKPFEPPCETLLQEEHCLRANPRRRVAAQCCLRAQECQARKCPVQILFLFFVWVPEGAPPGPSKAPDSRGGLGECTKHGILGGGEIKGVLSQKTGKQDKVLAIRTCKCSLNPL